MSLTLIIRNKGGRHVCRSEQECELHGEGWGGTMTDEQKDKLKFLERKAKEQTGSTKPFFKLAETEKVE